MTPPSVRKASPTVASILSIIPGVGQMYAGSFRRGLTILLATVTQVGVFSLASSTLTAKGLPTEALTHMEYWLVLLWLWNIRDAWKLSARQQA
jgi:hypothetical protein